MNNKTVNGMKCVLYLFGLLMLALPAQGASFECLKAQTKVERLICDNPEISKLDDELTAVYKAVLQDSRQADSVRQAQKQWIKERNRCAATTCILDAYKARLSHLHSTSLFSAASPDDANYSDYELDKDQKYYPDRADFEGEFADPVKDPKVCELYLKNLRYFTRRNLPMSCGQPVAPMLTDKVKPVEWENLDPDRYPGLFKAVVAKVFPPGPSDKENYPSDATLSSWREKIRNNTVVFRRAMLNLSGHVWLQSKYSRTKESIAFQIVQFGFNVTDSENPDARMRCEQSTGRVMPQRGLDQNLFIVSKDLDELYAEMFDLQQGFDRYLNLWLINGQPYGEQYDRKGTVLLSEIRSGSFERACLFRFSKTH